ncbi:MAG: beta-galactosidase [Firmicutes bacterium]|jgi:beta-galactosidase|nr:beta-galactosidase [Bacillota bacterium]
MINPKLPKIWYGGDYNPDQWPSEIWQEDMRLFKLAHIDVASLPIFSWSLLQPEEERYEFGWLDEILDLMAKNGIYACLATSTAAHPAWMARRYPDVLRVDFQGRKRRFGIRHNSCPNSPTYRHYSSLLAGKLAERYKDHPTLVAWHVSNEYGGECYCDNCARAFRVWLQRRYGSLDEVNERWNTRFWNHTFYDWDEIVPPNILTEHTSELDHTRTAFQGISLDYQRFMSDSLLECYKLEYEAIKKHTPDIKVTTNFMGTYKPLNYFAWAPYLDVISWDNYPSNRSDMSTIALRHDLMRGLKEGQPFMLMEQTPSQVNWQAHNALKRPGAMRLWSYQAVAHGADTVMFFQLRQSRGACEKFHGAVISHAGHENTRVFRECAQLGKELAELGDAIVDSRLEAKAAILFDWENWWALEFSMGPTIDLKYLPQIEKYYRACWSQNIPVDIISPAMSMDKYDVVMAPAAYLLQPGYAARVEEFVAKGGTFLTTFFSGIVDENDRVVLGGHPGELRKVVGVWVEETDPLFPDMRNAIVVPDSFPELAGNHTAGLICDLIHAETAEVVGTYDKDFYSGRPALTRNKFGDGWAWYVASDPEQSFVNRLVGYLCSQKGIEPALETPEGVEVTKRHKDGRTITFVLNHNDETTEVDLDGEIYRDLLTGQTLTGRVSLAGRDLLILSSS